MTLPELQEERLGVPTEERDHLLNEIKTSKSERCQPAETKESTWTLIALTNRWEETSGHALSWM